VNAASTRRSAQPAVVRAGAFRRGSSRSSRPQDDMALGGPAVYNIVLADLQWRFIVESDLTRLGGAIVAASLVAIAAVILARRFPRQYSCWRFLAGGLVSVQAVGPLLKPVP